MSKISISRLLAPLRSNILGKKDMLIPAISFKQAGDKYKNSRQWLHFAKNISQSKYMRKYVKRRGVFADKAGIIKIHLCLWCGARILNDNFHVHHSSYEHKCTYEPNFDK